MTRWRVKRGDRFVINGEAYQVEYAQPRLGTGSWEIVCWNLDSDSVYEDEDGMMCEDDDDD
jgi:hypothetical protein